MKRVWLKHSDSAIICSECGNVMRITKDNYSSEHIHCSDCGAVYLNDNYALSYILNHWQSVYSNENIIYDKALQDTIYFLSKFSELQSWIDSAENVILSIMNELLPEDFELGDCEEDNIFEYIVEALMAEIYKLKESKK